jgi:UDP-N-acetyl-D-galactosamine dehydrogenase
MNELALIFDRMGIDTGEVLEAAATKWNFLPFWPGLVGGHCIGVDPHYLAWKAMQLGYEPQVILSGRKVNEKMGVFVGEKMIALLAAKYQGQINGLRVLVLGFAFKENCADTRNTKVVDIVHTLEKAGVAVTVYDPLIRTKGEVAVEYGISLSEGMEGDFAGIVLAVAHEVFRGMDFSGYKEKGVVVFDAKGVVEKEWVDGRL